MDDLFLGPDGVLAPHALSQGLLASFFDAVPASVAIVDLNAELVAVNAAWNRFNEANGGCIGSWQGYNYLRITDLADDEDAAAIAGGLRAVLAGETPTFTHDYPCHGATQRRWFRCLISGLTEFPDGPLAGAAVMHVDITGQKLAELRALAASRAKSEFLASMSHELRTPLNAVIGFAEILAMEMWGPLDARYRSYGADIHQAGKHLLSLINEVLDLSKIEAGRFDLHEEVVDLGHLLDSCVRLVDPRARRAQITVVDAIGAPPRLLADARLVRQIVLNLLSNAVKFTPPGGTVTVRAGLDCQGGPYLSVADTGIGIAAEDIERALEPFGQIASKQAHQYRDESTGLGLPLCQRFAELHGGRLDIVSAAGRGTIMTVVFPPHRRR